VDVVLFDVSEYSRCDERARQKTREFGKDKGNGGESFAVSRVVA